MKMPPPVRQRRGGLLDWLDELYWAWRVSRPLRSETCELYESTDGTQILPHATSAAAAAAAVTYPFQVIGAPTEGAPRRLRVRYGEINALTVTGMFPGDSPAYYIEPAQADTRLWIKLTADVVGFTTAISIESGGATPPTPNSSTSISASLASFAFDGAGKLTAGPWNSIRGSQSAVVLGDLNTTQLALILTRI